MEKFTTHGKKYMGRIWLAQTAEKTEGRLRWKEAGGDAGWGRGGPRGTGARGSSGSCPWERETKRGETGRGKGREGAREARWRDLEVLVIVGGETRWRGREEDGRALDRELTGAEGLVPGSDGAAGNQGAAAGDRARSIWKPWGGAAGMGGSRERRWLTRWGKRGRRRRLGLVWW